jgi:hypothetical protein
MKLSAKRGERMHWPVALGICICASVLLAVAPGSADEFRCANLGIEVFPPPGEIPSNAVFILQGDGGQGETLRSLSSADIALRSEGVDLRVRILSRSNGYMSHVVFAPAAGRLPEGPIELRVPRLHFRPESPGNPAGRWTVSSTADRTIPDLNASESTASLTRRDSIWSESVQVDFSVSASESPILLLASVQESKGEIPTGKREELLLFPHEQSLYRGPCSRNHALERAKQYLVDLVPIDAAGNRGRSTGEVFVVDVP